MRKLAGICAIIGLPLVLYGAYLILIERKFAGVLIGLGGLMVLAVRSKLIDMDNGR